MMSVFRGEPGTVYQPSNGTEGEGFISQWCSNCRHDDLDHDTGEGGCQILCLTMALRQTDPDYPKEWVYGEDGLPKCTAFVVRGTGVDPRMVAEAKAKYDALPRDPKTGRPIIA